MSILLIGLVILSATCLVAIPMVRLWTASSEQIQKSEGAPALAPY
jgi:hypothetical protein